MIILLTVLLVDFGVSFILLVSLCLYLRNRYYKTYNANVFTQVKYIMLGHYMSLESLLNNYSFTCIIIAMLATLCFSLLPYNYSSYYKIASFLDCYIDPAFSVIHSLFLFSFLFQTVIINIYIYYIKTQHIMHSQLLKLSLRNVPQDKVKAHESGLILLLRLNKCFFYWWKL